MSIKLLYTELADLPLNTLYTWDISHTLDTTYHPYCHSPSALTEYLKQKLRVQRAKHLGRSPFAQVEQNVPLKRNTNGQRLTWGLLGKIMDQDRKSRRVTC